jgi:hypothetical protein
MRVVVPLDGSQFATRAIPAAMVIARAASAGITLVGVAADDSEASSLPDHVRDAAQLLPIGADVAEAVIVDADPVAVLLEMAADPDQVLCLASHDHMPAATAILHSVGSAVLERAFRPMFVVGHAAEATATGTDVVVAVDGQHDPEPLLAVAVRWGLLFDAPLRVVTVYEPVLDDIRRPEHFTRAIGPPIDPDLYLEQVKARLDGIAVRGVELASIPDPASVAGGLSRHLAERPGMVLVAGGQHHRRIVAPGVLRELLRTVVVPVLFVPRPAEQATSVRDVAEAGVDSALNHEL